MSTSVSKKALKLAAEKLALSGLTMADAKKLGLDVLTELKTAALQRSFKAVCSLQFNYYDHDGQPMTDWPKSKPFYRVRYLEVPPTDFPSDEKPIRYVQPPETAPCAYFPMNQDWRQLIKDSSQPLIITEGELKAAKACKEGFPTIGLGGVYSWRSKHLGLTWLPSLECVVWVKRHVYICFDSDYRTNPMVCAALHELSTELHRRGAFVHMVSLPQLPDLEKVGLDDFLVNAGPSANDMFLQLLEMAEPLGLTAPLWSLNERYVYVRNPGLIIDQQDLENKIAPGAFKEHQQSTVAYQERSLLPDGSISFKAVSAAAAWLKWPLRQEVSKLTYAPGKDRFVSEGNQLRYNIWLGWGVEPVKGQVKLFKQLIDHLFTGAEPGAKEWFLKWLAYPLQYPGQKMFSSAVLHGIYHGTGKSLIGYTMKQIYGANFTEISEVDLHNNYNEWAEGIQFAMGDDVTGSDKKHEMNFLKKIITQQDIRINPKYVRSYKVPDCINYYFTANGPDSFFLEDKDRRFFIHEIIVGPLSEQFYTSFEQEVLKGGGAAAVFYYLLNLDTKDFNPSAPAFDTAAKSRMINNTQSDLATWVRGLVANPDYYLRLGEAKMPYDLYTSKALLTLYDPHGSTRTTANGIGRELSRAGVRQVLSGQPVRLPDGSQQRYYALRRPEHWLTASLQEVTAHLSDASPKKKKGKNY